MMEEKNSCSVTRKMNVTFKNEEEYQKFIRGTTHSDKGIRTADGKMSSQPDIEEIYGEYEEQYYPIISEYAKANESVGTRIIVAIVEGLIEGVSEYLSNEENRAMLASVAKRWWKENAVPGMKTVRDSLNKKISFGRDVLRGITGKTKIELIMEGNNKYENTDLSEITPSVVSAASENLSARENIKNKIDAEEVHQEIMQIRLLAMLLANKLKNLSNKCVAEFSPEHQRKMQSELSELMSEEVTNSIKLMVANQQFCLDDPTERIFVEFLAGNLIVNNELVPIEKVYPLSTTQMVRTE